MRHLQEVFSWLSAVQLEAAAAGPALLALQSSPQGNNYNAQKLSEHPFNLCQKSMLTIIVNNSNRARRI